MALASTNQFRDFYSDEGQSVTSETRARQILATLMDAPWMSSGLTDNNAFTTTLALRAFGFLHEEGLLGADSPKPDSIAKGFARAWAVHLGIRDAVGLAEKLKARSEPASEFLWFALSDDTRNLLEAPTEEGPQNEDRLKAALALDLSRTIQGGFIYTETRFPKASKTTRSRLRGKPTGYTLAIVNRLLLADQFPDEILPPTPRSFMDIASLLAERAENFSINQYQPSAAVLYWFVDGVTRSNITLTQDRWNVIYTWAAKEFNHRRSLVVAEHDALMDPIAMGMSACLCARLRAISDRSGLGTTKEHRAILPSSVELERSIEELISKQTGSGIWHKYFPLFHYQDAGSNFCFTFELLEAVLCEFGGATCALLSNAQFIEGMEKAVTWCKNNRLKYSEKSIDYTGWNSGGQLVTLEKGQPESWATAVVHMFLSELTSVLSARIQDLILRKYNAREPKAQRSFRDGDTKATPPTALGGLLDIDILLRGKTEPLSSVLRTRIIDNYRSESHASLRRTPKKKPRSALLFGPPGTSKTEITRAVADDLGWPLLELTPSEFVKGSLANVYLQADEIFRDLMDLSGVVVFFDEMDALVQTREGEIRLDIASQFLTTTMLPKLTQLHDKARVVFFMATNFQDRFDAAIKRAGRFDLLLCMGPPKVTEKLDRVNRVIDVANEQAVKAGNLMKRYLRRTPDMREQLALYTFGEYKAFLKTIGDEKKIGDALESLGPVEFRRQLKAYSKFVTLKVSDLAPLRRIGIKWRRLAELDKKMFTLKQLLDKKLPISHIVRYYCDRKESKEQY